MKVLKQLAVFVANRPGTLAEVCRILGERGINILGLAVADSVDHAVLRLVVDKPAAAIHILGETGLLVLDTDIVAVRLPNGAGRMSELGMALSRIGVNIEYAYGGLQEDDEYGTLYLKVQDIEKARPTLEALGL